MKIKSGFICRKIAGENIVIPMGDNIANFNGIIKLNKSAAFLWNILQEDRTKHDLIEALIEKYKINKELALKDVEKFIDILYQNKVIEGI